MWHVRDQRVFLTNDLKKMTCITFISNFRLSTCTSMSYVLEIVPKEAPDKFFKICKKLTISFLLKKI